MKILSIIVIFTLLLGIRVLIASLPYSGMNKPPMRGDFEAQRHWMEITTSLPISTWYFNTSDNDLQYWGLDYPPLTAYHSYLCGIASEWYEPGSMTLYKSRGYETPSHKWFMRFTVILADILLLFPAVWYAVSVFYKNQPWSERLKVFVAMAAHPGLLLIDHGHFQYNSIALSLSLLGIAFILDNHELIGSICFVLSLNYKQMGLYYAPSFFFFLLAKSYVGINTKTLKNLYHLGNTVISTFLACWMPFILLDDPMTQVLQILHRIFPVSRGLYEDKVANFWCSISPIYKLQKYASQETMVKVCLVTTLIAMAPAAFVLLRSFQHCEDIHEVDIINNDDNVSSDDNALVDKPPQDAVVTSHFNQTDFPSSISFLVSLVSIAWSFFFFSFHVHEKSILYPVFPLTLLLLKLPVTCAVSNLVSIFSMLPLLARDGHLVSAYIVSILSYGFYVVSFSMTTLQSMVVFLFGIAVPSAFHAISVNVPPPASYPDIWRLLLTSVCFATMVVSWLHLLIVLFLNQRLSTLLAYFEPKQSDSIKIKQD